MSQKVALILSGCGGLDGAEIQEAVCSILAIEESGLVWEAFSLDQDQKKVISHLTMNEMDQKRNMMAESARITHGKIKNIDALDVNDYDILWLPGGYGVVSSFSNIAENGADGTVCDEIQKVIKGFFSKNKPIVALCIAPSVIAKTLQNQELDITLGTSDKFFVVLEKLGHHPKKISSEEFLFDQKNNLYTSPAYMEKDASCFKIYKACKKIVKGIKNAKSSSK